MTVIKAMCTTNTMTYCFQLSNKYEIIMYAMTKTLRCSKVIDAQDGLARFNSLT